MCVMIGFVMIVCCGKSLIQITAENGPFGQSSFKVWKSGMKCTSLQHTRGFSDGYRRLLLSPLPLTGRGNLQPEVA